MKTPKLIPLNMSLADKHEHPKIKEDLNYLCLFHRSGHDVYSSGTFHRQWYGWSFCGGQYPSLQFDEPGTNGSRWIQIWEIKT